MRLTLQQKEQFFHEMRELLASGRSFGESLEVLSTTRTRSIREVAKRMQQAADRSMDAAFEAAGEVFTPLDREVARGGELSGKLEVAMGYLAKYYSTMHRTRQQMLVHSAYPVFMVHAAAVLLSVPLWVGQGFGAFLASAATILGVFYAVVAVAWLLTTLALRFAHSNPLVDQIIQRLPVFGKTRVALAGSRFCLIMGILVKGGGSILNSMSRAALASGSALFRAGAEQAVVAVQNGGALGAAVAKTQAFPESIDRAFQIGEVSGRLGEEMERQADRYVEQFGVRMEVLTSWLTKFLYMAILLGIFYMILTQILGMFQMPAGLEYDGFIH